MEDRSDQDQHLVESVLRGDAERYGDLVTRYERLVASVAWRYGAPAAEIEDVVSEVFIKAYRNLHRYRPDHPFSTWLYRLAANHVVDYGRRAKKRQGQVEMPAELTDAAPTPDQGQESRERARLVRDCLEQVPVHYREVLFLVYVEGMKVNEAAGSLGLPSGTIKTRLMRGREALKKLLLRRHPEYFGATDAVSR